MIKNPGNYVSPGEWMVVHTPMSIVCLRKMGTKGTGVVSSSVDLNEGDLIQYRGIRGKIGYYNMYEFFLQDQDSEDGIVFWIKNPNSLFRFTREITEDDE